MRYLNLLIIIFFASPSFGKEFTTNSVHVKDAPDWVTQRVIERVSEKIENKLEWKTRRVPVIWHVSHDSFSKTHSLGPLAAAVTIKSKDKSEIHMGPEVTKNNYAEVYGHELVHVIFHQKYQGAIPDWLEEGFANYYSRKNKLDLNKLNNKKLPSDVTQMGHPYKKGKSDIRLHYQVSQALVEMLDDRCELDKLIRLSVRRQIETYIKRTCEIDDINKAFKNWLKKKALKAAHKEKTKNYRLVVEEVVSDLHIPWGFEFLNANTMLINEKNGQLSIYDLKKQKKTKLSGGPKVTEKGQGGSMDVKKHPKYPEEPWIYITYVAPLEKKLTTHLGRFKIQGQQVKEFQKLLSAKGGTDTSRHFGSRIAFDRENYVYFSVGDRGHRPNGQDLSTHAGSIMRLHADGQVPKDNPFVGKKGALPEIWSYGHRNPQGLVFDSRKGLLWSIEHGPRGGDEINLIEKGKNYGWPTISFGKEYWGPVAVGEDTHKKGMEQPVHYYVPSIAPCGLAVYYGDAFPEWNGSLLSGALKLTHLNRVEVKDKKFVSEDRLLQDMSQRIRHVKVGPEGHVYFSTDSGFIYRIRPS